MPDAERPEVLEAVAGQLAPEPLPAAERADMLRRLVDRTAEPDTRSSDVFGTWRTP
jgi:hypothetical protein